MFQSVVKNVLERVKFNIASCFMVCCSIFWCKRIFFLFFFPVNVSLQPPAATFESVGMSPAPQGYAHVYSWPAELIFIWTHIDWVVRCFGFYFIYCFKLTFPLSVWRARGGAVVGLGEGGGLSLVPGVNCLQSSVSFWIFPRFPSNEFISNSLQFSYSVLIEGN